MWKRLKLRICQGLHQLSSTILAACLCTCSTSQTKTDPAEALKAENQVSSDVSITESQAKFCFGSFPNLEKAWHAFADEGSYRMALAEDFKLPEEILRSQGRIPRIVDAPCVLGQLVADHSGTQFAAIIVHKQREDSNRFSVVIFDDVENKQAQPKPFLLFQNEDLSRAMIYTLSSRFIVANYQNEGAPQTCVVKWNSQGESFSCLPSLR